MTPKLPWKKVRLVYAGTRHECVLKVFNQVEFTAAVKFGETTDGRGFCWFVDLSDELGIGGGAEKTLPAAKLAAERVIKQYISGMHAGLETLLREVVDDGEVEDESDKPGRVLEPEGV